jgi:DNA-binding NtrC family response regulator
MPPTIDPLIFAAALPPPKRSRSASPAIRRAESAYEAVLGAEIIAALKSCDGDRTRTAEALGMERESLARLIKALGLKVAPGVRGPKAKKP